MESKKNTEESMTVNEMAAKIAHRDLLIPEMGLVPEDQLEKLSRMYSRSLQHYTNLKLLHPVGGAQVGTGRSRRYNRHALCVGAILIELSFARFQSWALSTVAEWCDASKEDKTASDVSAEVLESNALEKARKGKIMFLYLHFIGPSVLAGGIASTYKKPILDLGSQKIRGAKNVLLFRLDRVLRDL